MHAAFVEDRRKAEVGCVVPSGIATDDTTKIFFQDLMQTRSLVSLFSFDNKEGLFPAVKSSYRFCLLTLAGTGRPAVSAPEFVFYAGLVEHLQDESRRFSLSLEDIALLNPNTHTCPVFRGGRDAEITMAIYRRVPVLIREHVLDMNPWGISFLAMFHMANDSGLFRSAEELTQDGWASDGNTYVKDGQKCQKCLPLYEAKMIGPFDHRATTYEGDGTRALTSGEKDDPCRVIQPRYWVAGAEAAERLNERWNQNWLLGWQNVTDVNTMARTVKFCIMPRVGVGHTCPLMLPSAQPAEIAALPALFGSFVLDYIARQKIGGVHLTYLYLKQLPVPTLETFRAPSPWFGACLASWLLPRVVELTYTAWDLAPFARDCGYEGPPFRWDEGRRFLLRAELDAAFFHLYGIERADVDYIMETFPIVKRKDVERHGDYRTKRVILEIYDELAAAVRTGKPYQTRLDPPPADPRIAHPPRAAAAPTRQEIARGKAVAYAEILLDTWNAVVGRDALEAGLVLMFNDDLRRAVLAGRPAKPKAAATAAAAPAVRGLGEMLKQMCSTGALVELEAQGRQAFQLGAKGLASMPTLSPRHGDSATSWQICAS